MIEKDITNKKVVEFIEGVKEIIKIDLESIREEFRGMNSKIWIDTKSNKESIARIYAILGFLDNGLTRYNGIITRIENYEIESNNFKIEIKKEIDNLKKENNIEINTLKTKQFFLWGIGAILGVPMLGIFVAIIKRII